MYILESFFLPVQLSSSRLFKSARRLVDSLSGLPVLKFHMYPGVSGLFLLI